MLKHVFVDSNFWDSLGDYWVHLWLQVHWDENDVDLIPDGSHIIVDQANK